MQPIAHYDKNQATANKKHNYDNNLCISIFEENVVVISLLKILKELQNVFSSVCLWQL